MLIKKDNEASYSYKMLNKTVQLYKDQGDQIFQ